MAADTEHDEHESVLATATAAIAPSTAAASNVAAQIGAAAMPVADAAHVGAPPQRQEVEHLHEHGEGDAGQDQRSQRGAHDSRPEYNQQHSTKTDATTSSLHSIEQGAPSLRRRDTDNNVAIDMSSDEGRKSESGSDASGTSGSQASSDSGKETLKRASVKDLFRYATKWDLFFNFCGLLAACAAGAAQPIMTIVFGNLTTTFLSYTNALIDEASTPQSIAAARAVLEDKIRQDALYLVYVGIAMFCATYIYMSTWVYSGEVVTSRTRQAYLKAVLRQEMAYFDSVGPGEITTRIQNDIHLIQEGISDKVPMSFMFIATFIAGFIVAFSRSWQLSLAMSSILPCIVAAGAGMNVFVTKYQQIELEYVSRAATIAEEALSTVRTAKAFAIEQRLVNLYDESNVETTKQGKRKALIQGLGLGVFFFIIYASYALAFYFGSKLLAEGHMSSGTIMNVIFSIFIGAFSLAMLAPNLTALSYALSAAAKVYETIDRQSAIDPMDPSGLKPNFCNGDIECKNIHFRYPARPEVPILEDFSLKIRAGTTTALVGASGSGKSTIVNLLERYYNADEGDITLDGSNIRDLNITWLRTQMGLVSQEPSLFSTTIRDNIEYGLVHTQWQDASPEKKKELVEEAAKKANAHSFILDLPKGYDTLVGERGFLMSGGQKQRIAIARAIVKQPKILLLDEATSALDTQSEEVVQEALDKASEGRTTITIAHRLSTVKKSNLIVVMGKGVILEQGSHEELMSRSNGPYFNLVDAQRIRGGETRQNTYDDAAMVRRNGQLKAADAEDLEKGGEDLGRKTSNRPNIIQRISSKLSEKQSNAGEKTKPRRSGLLGLLSGNEGKDDTDKAPRRGLFYLLYRLALINRDKIWTLYIPGVVASVASGAVYPAFSVLFGRSLDAFSLCSANQSSGEMQPCPEPFRSEMRRRSDDNALYFFIISLLATIATGVQNGNLINAASILMERLRNKTLKALLRADVSYFDADENSSGSLTSALAENSQRINGLVGVTLGTIIQSISTLIVGWIIALAYSWKLALPMIATAPLTLSAGFLRLHLVVLKDKRVKRAHEHAAMRACEAAAQIRTVASLTREESTVLSYREDLKGPARVTHNTALYGNILYAIGQAIALPTIALGFWYGSRLLVDGEISSGHFFTVLTATVFASIQAGNAFSFVPDVSQAHGAADESIKILDNVPEIDAESEKGEKLENCEGRITFEDVHFRYPTRKSVRVLSGLDLEIQPGTYVALVGSSGCGKSTTIQLVERFYDVLAGRVLIDGKDIRTLNVRSLRRHIALVSQEPTLYEGTIGWNIALGAAGWGVGDIAEDGANATDVIEKVTEQQMRKAARQANILKFIDSLPDGFDTRVGNRGTALSGGQKQRIAIARALIRDPKILLLDEATSALDSESETVVQQALDKASRGRTTIAIAHRLSTISRADRIFCLRGGKVVEQGDHNTLMAQGGLYAQLVSLQELQKESV